MSQKQGPRLGVGIRALDKDMASYFPGSDKGSVLIEKIYEDSAAEAAGLKTGDVVLSFGGEKIADREAFQKAVASAEAGEVDMMVLRHGKETSISVTLPEAQSFSIKGDEPIVIKKQMFQKQHGEKQEQRMEELEKKLEKLLKKLEDK